MQARYEAPTTSSGRAFALIPPQTHRAADVPPGRLTRCPRASYLPRTKPGATRPPTRAPMTRCRRSSKGGATVSCPRQDATEYIFMQRHFFFSPFPLVGGAGGGTRHAQGPLQVGRTDPSGRRARSGLRRRLGLCGNQGVERRNFLSGIGYLRHFFCCSLDILAIASAD